MTVIPIEFDVNPVSIRDLETAPLRDFDIVSVYPNPFNASTSIIYHLPEAGKIKLSVYDVFGREVAELFVGNQTAGAHKVVFNGGKFPTGLYFYSLETGDRRAFRKMLLLR